MPVCIGREVVPKPTARNACPRSGPPTSPAVPRIPVQEEGFNGQRQIRGNVQTL